MTDDIDKKFVYSNLRLAQDLLNYKENQISAVEIKLDNGVSASDLQKELKEEVKAVISYMENEFDFLQK